MATTNLTHRKKLARAYAEAAGLSYQQALAAVTDADARGLLPRRLDAAGIAAALARRLGGPYTSTVGVGEGGRRTSPRCDVCDRKLRSGEPWWLVWQPGRGWAADTGVGCGAHDPARLPAQTVAEQTIGHPCRTATAEDLTRLAGAFRRAGAVVSTWHEGPYAPLTATRTVSADVTADGALLLTDPLESDGSPLELDLDYTDDPDTVTRHLVHGDGRGLTLCSRGHVSATYRLPDDPGQSPATQTAADGAASAAAAPPPPARRDELDAETLALLRTYADGRPRIWDAADLHARVETLTSAELIVPAAVESTRAHLITDAGRRVLLESVGPMNRLWATSAGELVKVSRVYPPTAPGTGYVTAQVVYPVPPRTTVRSYTVDDVSRWRPPTDELVDQYETAWGLDD